MFARYREELEALAEQFDAALVDASTADAVIEDATRIEHIAASVKAAAMARVADTRIWNAGGDRSAAEALARRTGVRVSDARAVIETGRKLRELPATSEAARRGELSPAQTAAIADAALVDPHAESELLERARRASLHELRQECARFKARFVDLEERRRRIHAQRSVRDWVDAEGVGHLELRDNPERVATIVSRIARTRDRLAEEARGHGRAESPEAHAADALYEIAGTETAPDAGVGSRRVHPDVKLLVRVDLPVLLRGYPAGGEVCEIVGYGPVPVSVLHDLIDTADPFLAAIATDGEQVAGVAHLGRRANAKQRSALEWLYPTCAVEGCTRSTFLENDHREDWARTGLTLLEWQDRYCGHHHLLKTTKGWMLVEGHGKRPMVPPGDPRHPRHAAPANGPPAAA